MLNRQIIKKLVTTFITIILSTFILFALVRLSPGDPVRMLLGNQETADMNSMAIQEKYQEKREELFLHEPIPKQYLRWTKNILSLNLGTSIYSGQSVSQELLEKLPATIGLTVIAILVQLLLGLSLGTLSGVHANTFLDTIIRVFCSFFSSLPGFSVSLVLIYIFSVKLKMYEISTMASLNRIWLPAFTLGLMTAPGFIRFIRSSILEEMGKLYVYNDLAMGAKKSVLVAGIFKNIKLNIITVTTTTFSNLIGGSVVIESIFSWPGIGKYAMDSILMLDYPVIQGYGLFMVLLVIIVNTIVDLTYILCDPEIKQNNRRRDLAHEK